MEIEIGSERVSNRLTVVSWWAKRTFLRELLEPEAPEKMGRCEGEDLSEGLRKLGDREGAGASVDAAAVGVGVGVGTADGAGAGAGAGAAVSAGTGAGAGLAAETDAGKEDVVSGEWSRLRDHVTRS